MSASWSSTDCGSFTYAAGLRNVEENKPLTPANLMDLSDIPNIILVSGGQEKIAVMRAALANTRISVLITDEDAAKGLLNR